MNAILYRVFLALARHLRRANDADINHPRYDGLAMYGTWDDYAFPYPEAEKVQP